MSTADKYLKAIYLIQQEHADSATTGAIAERLGVSPASANEMVGKLQAQGFVDHEKYKGVDLTEEGAERARDALQKYCIIERFLFSVLEVNDFRQEAGELEGVIDETVAGRLDTIIDRESECPNCFDIGADLCEFLEVPAPVDG